MNHETCPHCGMTWNKTVGEYECGSYPAGSSVVRATACTEIESLRTEIAERDAANKKDSELAVSLYQENAELQAQLAKVRAVPEFSDIMREAWKSTGLVMHGDPDVVRYGNMVGRFVYENAASRANSVPASRVLKDGEVAVDAAEWEAMCSLGFNPEPCRFDHHGYCQEHNWFSEKPCPTAILQKMYALRTQGKEGAT